jgi:hypothetical protein
VPLLRAHGWLTGPVALLARHNVAMIASARLFTFGRPYRVSPDVFETFAPGCLTLPEDGVPVTRGHGGPVVGLVLALRVEGNQQLADIEVRTAARSGDPVSIAFPPRSTDRLNSGDTFRRGEPRQLDHLAIMNDGDRPALWDARPLNLWEGSRWGYWNQQHRSARTAAPSWGPWLAPGIRASDVRIAGVPGRVWAVA